MYCSISGITPEEPVVSRKSGLLFERRLVVKALAASGGKCPETGEDLSEDDLIAVKLSGSVTRPAPASAASLPGLLTHMQNEWDAVALETHSVKKALAAAHQELASALYKYDAATRVIARLIKERDEARASLANGMNGSAHGTALRKDEGQRMDDGSVLGPEAAGVTSGEPGTDEPDVVKSGEKGAGGTNGEANGEANGAENGFVKIEPALSQRIQIKAAEMTGERKQRSPSPGLASIADLKEFVETHKEEIADADGEDSATGASSRRRIYAIQPMPIASDDDFAPERKEVIAVGSGDGAIRVFEAGNLSCVGSGAPKAHVGAVSCLAYGGAAHPSLLFSGGDDGIVRGWDCAALQGAAASAKSPEGSKSGEKEKQSGPSNRRRRSSSSSGVPDPVVPMVELRDEEAFCSTSPVTGVAVHPCGDMVLSSLANGRWRLHAIEGGDIVGSGPIQSPAIRVDSMALQPDGAVFALGLSSGAVELYDIKSLGASSKSVVTFGDFAAVGEATSVCMSENGYYMVVAGRGVVRVWDLRKFKMTREARITDSKEGSCAAVLDWSGSFCAAAVGTGTVRLFETRKLKQVVELEADSSGIARVEGSDEMSGRIGVAWGADARAAFVGTGNGRLLRYGRKEN